MVHDLEKRELVACLSLLTPMDPICRSSEGRLSLADLHLVRWIKHGGGYSQLRLIKPSGHARAHLSQRDGRVEEGPIHDFVELSSGPRLVQARVVARRAPVEIGAVLKGLPTPYGNASVTLGNALSRRQENLMKTKPNGAPFRIKPRTRM